MNNAIIAVIKSVLHSSMRYSREYSDMLAREIASFIFNNGEEIVRAYGITDEYELVETFTRDYLAEIKS